MARDPQTVAEQWAARLGQSTTKITDGVNAVTTAPGQKAARQKSVWVANTTASADKFAANSAKVTLEDWKGAMISKGAPRIASGASAAIPKMAAFLSRFLPYVDSVRAGLPPRGDLNANINRMVQNAQKMAQFNSQGR